MRAPHIEAWILGYCGRTHFFFDFSGIVLDAMEIREETTTLGVYGILVDGWSLTSWRRQSASILQNEVASGKSVQETTSILE
jgi:hypothetical protein